MEIEIGENLANALGGLFTFLMLAIFICALLDYHPFRRK